MERQTIRVLEEARIRVEPEPGESYYNVAITYQLPPRPPSVLFVREDDLPDLVWRREHPGVEEVPRDVLARGDKIRRERILAQLRGGQGRPGRALP